LSITGTDLDLTIQLTLAVGGDGDGGVVLPARLAADIVRSMGAGKVEVEVDGDEVNISGGRSNFSVRPLSFDDYPKLAPRRTSSVTLPSAAVGEALRQVVRAASTDEARPILTGVLLTAENGGCGWSPPTRIGWQCVTLRIIKSSVPTRRCWFPGGLSTRCNDWLVVARN
jgi:DNA polymerase-3 subunit beta